MSSLQTYHRFKLDFQKVDRHTGGKWLIHRIKRRKDNLLHSLELPMNAELLWKIFACDMYYWWTKSCQRIFSEHDLWDSCLCNLPVLGDTIFLCIKDVETTTKLISFKIDRKHIAQRPQNELKRDYRKTSDISRTLVDNWIVDNSDVVGASPVGAAPTTSSFST